MKRTFWVGFVLLAGCVRAPLMTGNSSGDSANSANSANSSNGNSMPMSNSSKSSEQSTGSSAQSNQSSANSNASSQASSEGSRNSSTGSSQQSSNNTTDKSTSAPSSQIVMGSALLTAVAGGIVLTVFTVKWRHEARLERERLRQLQFSPDGHPIPQPMPYPVQPIPPDPSQPQAPEPDFAPAPFPKKAEVRDVDAKVLARSWLVANELQLKQDLALGWGPTLEDLAGLAGIAPAHRERFGKVLQRHRRELVVSAEVSPDEAAAVMARVGDLVMTDPVLRADAVVALAAW
ncbi:MAG: hypothetical protein DI536_29125 [Archangium gephyra]|uniref:Lipoprotein n=1 Tax=Archangium gephyra TaxID=48 RepID=A0A2W5UUF7_9BACT|nr:MAG: hypothetical protein DI536_29125 [Archangium gephyra]